MNNHVQEDRLKKDEVSKVCFCPITAHRQNKRTDGRRELKHHDGRPQWLPCLSSTQFVYVSSSCCCWYFLFLFLFLFFLARINKSVIDDAITSMEINLGQTPSLMDFPRPPYRGVRPLHHGRLHGEMFILLLLLLPYCPYWCVCRELEIEAKKNKKKKKVLGWMLLYSFVFVLT